MAGILSKLRAAFDPEAGLADVLSRSAPPQPKGRAVPSPPRKPASQSGRLQAVCDHIDMLSAYLTAAITSAQTNPFAGAAYLDAARPNLMQLRSGLANRTLPRNEAEQLIDRVEHDIGQSDQILRAQHSSSLEETLHNRLGGQADLGGTLTDQLHVLRRMVIRLYNDADDTASLVPVL